MSRKTGIAIVNEIVEAQKELEHLDRSLEHLKAPRESLAYKSLKKARDDHFTFLSGLELTWYVPER